MMMSFEKHQKDSLLGVCIVQVVYHFAKKIPRCYLKKFHTLKSSSRLKKNTCRRHSIGFYGCRLLVDKMIVQIWHYLEILREI